MYGITNETDYIMFDVRKFWNNILEIIVLCQIEFDKLVFKKKLIENNICSENAGNGRLQI